MTFKILVQKPYTARQNRHNHTKVLIVNAEHSKQALNKARAWLDANGFANCGLDDIEIIENVCCVR